MTAVASKPKKTSKKSAKPDGAAASRPLIPITTSARAEQPGVDISVRLDELVLDDLPNRQAAEAAMEIEELARSMGHHGQLQQIGVTTFGVDGATDADTPRYRVVWGHRRIAAARLLKWERLQATLHDCATEQDVLIARGVENFQRRELTPVDEAMVVAHVVSVYETQLTLGPTAEPPRGEQPNLPVPAKHAAAARAQATKQAAEYFGKSEQWVRDRAFLARLGDRERELVATGRLPLSHAREIAKLADPAMRADLAKRAAANPKGNYGREYPMGLDELKRMVAQNLLSLAQVPWKLDVPFANAPACVECPSNSANEPGLFESGTLFSRDKKEAMSKWGAGGKSEPTAGVCTNQACYRRKASSASAAARSAAGKAATAIKAMPVKERPKSITPSTLPVPVARHLNPSTVAALTRGQLEKKPAKTRTSSGSSSYMSPAPNPRRDAEDKFEEAMRVRCDKLEPLLAKQLAKTPGAWSLFKIFMEHELVRKTDGKGGAKVLAGPAMQHLLKLLSRPTLEAFAEVEKGCGRMMDLLDSWYHGRSGLAEAIAAAVGVDVEAALGPRPTVEDFLPKSAKSAAKPPTKKKPKADPRVEPGRERAGIDDVEEDET